MSIKQNQRCKKSKKNGPLGWQIYLDVKMDLVEMKWKTLFEVSRRERKKPRQNSALCRERLCYKRKKPALCFACVFIFDDVITADSPSTAGSYLLIRQVTALNQSKRSSWLQFFLVFKLSFLNSTITI